MEISEKIKKLRKKKGFSQKDLAEKSGLSIASIQGYEQGKYKPKMEATQKLAKALGVLAYDIQTPKDSPEVWVEDEFGTMQYAKKIASETGRDFLKVYLDMLTPPDDYRESEEDQLEEFLDSMDMFGSELNKPGMDKAVELVELITKVPEYRKKPRQSPDPDDTPQD